MLFQLCNTYIFLDTDIVGVTALVVEESVGSLCVTLDLEVMHMICLHVSSGGNEAGIATYTLHKPLSCIISFMRLAVVYDICSGRQGLQDC